MTEQPPDRILRLNAVLDRTGLTRATLYRKIQAGTFPKQVRIATRCTGWRESAIREWMRNPMFYRVDQVQKQCLPISNSRTDARRSCIKVSLPGMLRIGSLRSFPARVEKTAFDGTPDVLNVSLPPEPEFAQEQVRAKTGRDET